MATETDPNRVKRVPGTGFERQTISACLIVMNEAERLREALESVSFCDEVIVVDGGSTDGTQQVARDLGATLIEHPWPGYAKQRNVAIHAATSEWVLEVDADERISPGLAREIEEFLCDPPASLDMAILPLRDTFLGRTLGPSAKYPKYRNRLFRKASYLHDEQRLVHEGLIPKGEVQPMRNELVHILASDWREAFGDCVRYARLEAKHRERPGVGELVKGTLFRPLFKFVYRSFALGGWRDGFHGIAWITTECVADSLATALSLRGNGTQTPGPRRGTPTGSVRIAGIAGSKVGAARGAAWLEDASRAGADVTLIAAEPPPTALRVHRLPHFGPLETLRALEVESQVRPIDAIVVHDRRAWLLGLVPPQRGLPRRLRAYGSEPSAEAFVHEVERRARDTSFNGTSGAP